MNYFELKQALKPFKKGTAARSFTDQADLAGSEFIKKMPLPVRENLTELYNDFRLGFSAVPEEAYETISSGVPTQVKVRPMGPTTGATYSHDPANKSSNDIISLNATLGLSKPDDFTNRIFRISAPTHEIGHNLILRPDKLPGTRYDSLTKDAGRVSAIEDILDALDFSDPKTASILKVPNHDEAYRISPTEVISRKLESPIRENLLPYNTKETYPLLRDHFNSRIAPATKNALDRFKTENPALWDLAAPNFTKYFPTIGAVALTAGASELASPPPASGALLRTDPSLLRTEDEPTKNEKGKTSKFDFSANVPKGTSGLVSKGLANAPRAFKEELLGGWEQERDANKTTEVFGGTDAFVAVMGRFLGGMLVDPLAKGSRQMGKARAGEPMLATDLPDMFEAAGSGVGPGFLAGGGQKGTSTLGAINMPGFYSTLTETLKAGGTKKIPLTAKMTGEQAINRLKNIGINPDEMNYTGVGNALREVGNAPIGESRFADLVKMAEENALGFEKEVTKGIHPGYSLFGDNDPSFKNTLYRYPGVEFEESHFGKGVVAHRRGGDKKLFIRDMDKLIELDKEREALFNRRFYSDDEMTFEEFDGIERRLKELDTAINSKEEIDSTHIDEIQSQFYEKGSKFGHGVAKDQADVIGESKFSEAYNLRENLVDGSQFSTDPNFVSDVQKYRELINISQNADVSTPQGFAEDLLASNDAANIYNKHTKPHDAVEDVPLQGTKYIELLLKDTLQEALQSGKKAISWTPSTMQEERYYGQNAMGGITWKYSGDGRIKIVMPDGNDHWASTIEYLDKTTGASNRKAIIAALKAGETEGKLDKAPKEVYQKIYDKSTPKLLEKLTGDKTKVAKTTDRNGKDVDVFYVLLDKVEKKMVKGESEIEVPDNLDSLHNSLKNFRAQYRKEAGDRQEALNTGFTHERIDAEIKHRRKQKEHEDNLVIMYREGLEDKVKNGLHEDAENYRSYLGKAKRRAEAHDWHLKYLEGAKNIIDNHKPIPKKEIVREIAPLPIASRTFNDPLSYA